MRFGKLRAKTQRIFPDLLFLALLENGKEKPPKKEGFLCLPNP